MRKIIFVLSIVVTSSFAQEIGVTYNRLAEEYFLLGVRQYSHKDYAAAVQTFQSSIDSYPMNHRITAATVMKAKSLFALRNFLQASVVCDSFLVRFPTSEYVEDILFTRGMCEYNEGWYSASIETMEKVYFIAQQRLNQEHSLKVIEHIASEYLEEDKFDSLITGTSNEWIRNTLKVIYAERMYTTGKSDSAKGILENVVDSLLSDGSLRDRIQRLRTRIERGNNISIGVLLPLLTNIPYETRDKKITMEILDGISFAVSEYEAQLKPGQVSVEINVRDTERKADTIREVIKAFAENQSIVAIVGPVFSDETMTAAQVAAEFSMPLISPTATDDSISLISDYVFQANSTSGLRGKLLAQYAINILGARRVGILASNAGFAKTQADSFSAEINRLGGTVVTDMRYQSGEPDLRGHFRTIRSVAANLSAEYVVSFKGKMNRNEITNTMTAFGFSLPFVDSVIARSAAVNVSQFVGEFAKSLVDSLKLPYKVSIPYVDSLHYPVTSIDVLFSPIGSSQQIGVISSQVKYYNIKTILLGTSEWNNIHELDLNRRYAEGVIFGSDRWIEQNSQTKILFSRFYQKYSRQMSDNALFGYDAMTLLISLLNDGALTREHMVKALSEVINFRGIRNSITLQYRRANSDLNILQYKNGTISKLQTFTYQP